MIQIRFIHESKALPLQIVSEVNSQSLNRHLQIANLWVHSGGHLLLVCRWDHQAISENCSIVWKQGEHLGNSSEGDNSNEQVLFFSLDRGASWQIANDGRSILTLAQGTSFDHPSAITHAFIDETADGNTWLYYTINQPMTCGRAYPWRSTGCGEIRRIAIRYDGLTWRADGTSEVVWGMLQPLPLANGWTNTVRISCLNPILRLEDGTMLMSISGRDTLPRPEGRYWKENRCWVLRSTDGGSSWQPSFIGGSNELCLCECTLTQLPDGSVYALMRAGYGTGKSLYAARSFDAGAHFSPPAPTGLPNTVGGVKPFLLRLRSGNYLLLQTDEHETAHRINVTAFLTDEEGLLQNRWHYKRVLCLDCKEKWQGSAYPTAVQEDAGFLCIAFAGFTSEHNRLYFMRLTEDWLREAAYEPAGGMLLSDHAVPTVDEAGMHFTNTRARAQAGCFGALSGQRWIRAEARVERYPQELSFDLLALYSHCGSQREIAVGVKREGVYLRSCDGEVLLCAPCRSLTLRLDVLPGNQYRVTVNGSETIAFGESFGDPDTLLTGGAYQAGEEIAITVTELSYGSQQ